jgi:hypothetical protein
LIQVDEERDAKEHHETNVGGERGMVFVDRVFGGAERKSAVLLGAVEDPVFWMEVGEIRWCRTCWTFIEERGWKVEVDEDSSRVWEVFLRGRSDVTDEFGKDDDTTFGETCWRYIGL